jgi:hypothetical protein
MTDRVMLFTIGGHPKGYVPNKLSKEWFSSIMIITCFIGVAVGVSEEAVGESEINTTKDSMIKFLIIDLIKNI